MVIGILQSGSRRRDQQFVKGELSTMADEKENAKPKATVKSANLKKEEAPKAEAAKAAEKKTTKTAAKKATAKKALTEVKAATAAVAAKADAVKTEVKKEVKAVEKKAAAKKAGEPTTEVNVQFDGKTYTTETLIQSAKDVWKYDLKKNPDDLKSIKLYVKTEESRVYYVMNDELGSFEI